MSTTTKAYAWAGRRRIEAHPATGAIQIAETRERVDELAAPPSSAPSGAAPPAMPQPLFAGLSELSLLSIGVPADWLDDVRAVSEDASSSWRRISRPRRPRRFCNMRR
ncbi:MAG: hypothetical protein JO038_04425 [Alphaproteobacteria bacterium]|nr:hypothetical protein [Alphaproteobacteria bacterium]